MKKIAIRAHGSKDPESGFSGGLGLLQYFHTHADVLDGEIVLVVSPFEDGSVATKTARYNEATGRSISHICLKDFSAEAYQSIHTTYGIDLHMFSGWLKLVRGMTKMDCVNIHPGPIQEATDPMGEHWSFGGKGMWGDHVHKKVWEAYQAGALHSTALTMHYMTEQFDDPRFLIGQCQIPILATDTHWEDPKSRLRKIEPAFQQYVFHQLVNGKISRDVEGVFVDENVTFDNARFGGLVDIG